MASESLLHIFLSVPYWCNPLSPALKGTAYWLLQLDPTLEGSFGVSTPVCGTSSLPQAEKSSSVH